MTRPQEIAAKVREEPGGYLYHGHCNDGFGAARAAVYGAPPPQLRPMDDAYILDFSYSREITARTAEACNLVLFDHHKTAAEDLEGIGGCHFDTERSGAVLAWKHFRPGEPVPEILLYVQDRDLWRQWQLPPQPGDKRRLRYDREGLRRLGPRQREPRRAALGDRQRHSGPAPGAAVRRCLHRTKQDGVPTL